MPYTDVDMSTTLVRRVSSAGLDWVISPTRSDTTMHINH